MSTDMSSLGSRLGLQEIWPNLNDKKLASLKKSQKSFNANIFVHIHFKNKTKKWNSIFIFLYSL